MSDVRDPDRDQVAPTPNDGPSCHDLVIEDMKERKQHGLRKYDNLLQPFNGRSFVLDAYEEALDLCVYLRGMLEEERAKRAFDCTELIAWADNKPVTRTVQPEADWAELGEDVSEHTMRHDITPHNDGRVCSFHERLNAYVFIGNLDAQPKRCLRDH